MSVAHEHHDDHGHGHHEELSFWRKYVFSIDHKVIGIQYIILAIVAAFVGMGLSFGVVSKTERPENHIFGSPK